jgi:hypothetical protein
MGTGSANLRKHLLTRHEEQYKQACEENGWDYYTRSVQVPLPTIGENRKEALPPFSPENFLVYLVRFVAADDQVRVCSITL